MRHRYFGRKLSRTKNERRRLLAGLARDVILHGTIRTTLARAKAVQPLVEKLVTKAKKGTDASRRKLLAVIDDKRVIDQLIADAKTRFANRNSGFTRIVRLGARVGDATEEVLFQFVDERVIAEVIVPKNVKAKEKPVKVLAAKKTEKKRGRPKKKELTG